MKIVKKSDITAKSNNIEDRYKELETTKQSGILCRGYFQF